MKRLPDPVEPPHTTLQILGRGQQEQDWQRMLFYFLRPENPHGLDLALLEHLLDALADHENLSFSYSRFDFDDIEIDLEVILSNGRRPDGLIWTPEEWFICWELKVDAAEGDDQTRDYVEATSFSSANLDKADVPAEEHHYIYLAPQAADPPGAEEFVHISWEWIADQIQSFVAYSDGVYSTRTTAQLNDFVSLIRSELTVSEYQESQEEKTELYLDYYEEISEVQSAFEEAWDGFAKNWGERLANRLDSAMIVEDPAVPDEYLAVDIEMENGDTRRWTFRQGHSDWSYAFPREWWTRLDEGQPIFDKEGPQARVGFLHRLEWHREDALADNNLIFYLRNAPGANTEFHDGFADRFRADQLIPELLPLNSERTGNKANVVEGTYAINSELYDDFFEAYIAALATAMEDHVIDNPQLVERIDQLYEETIEEDTPF